ncbi:ABC transporter ATP-binding protein [Candidatus Parcubacteria bacterium]|nr:MAG: ABC transporter ATP-binding protein [Candidatus Parcubacteria bacterium]
MNISRNDIPLKIESVCKKYSDKKVLENISLIAEKGKVNAIIGPNGAGKTTLIKIIVGLLQATSGEVYIFGKNNIRENDAVKKDLFYISDDVSCYEYLSGEEFVYFTGNLRGLNRKEIGAKLKSLIQIFPEMEKNIKDPISEYSKGSRQKLVFICSLLSDPKLLIIDEPIVGLDPVSITVFGKELKKFAQKGGAVFLSTHILSFAKDYVDKVCILGEGKILVEAEVKKDTNLEFMYKKVLDIK